MSYLTQLIDYDGNFIPSVEEWMIRESLYDQGFNFSVVTILGCQSSGKSTLLNILFNTQFEVMDASKGRNQTTKGLWLGFDKVSKSVIIDVEGTDSRERGEDHLTFEHRAALFSLALADVVIVNMWYHDLGRYTASNYGLLKTVLSVNMELFQQEPNCPKTVMIFVIRDYPESQTPLEALKKMIHEDIRSLWKEMTKPEHLQDSKADDFFKFKIVGLPSFILDFHSFTKKCEELKTMWYNECRPDSYSRRVPADGFGFYSHSVWDTILNSSELDIPSQKAMLATYRCEELKTLAFSEILPEISTYLNSAQEGALSTDFSWALSLIDKALDIYDVSASRYQKTVFEKKRLQLVQNIQSELQKIIDAYLTHVRHKIAIETQSSLEIIKKARGSDENVVLESFSRFSESASDWKTKSLTKFDEITSCLKLEYKPLELSEISEFHMIEFDFSQSRLALFESLDGMLLRERERHTIEFEKVFGRFAALHLGDLSNFLLAPNLTPIKFWESVDVVIESSKTQITAKLKDAYFGILNKTYFTLGLQSSIDGQDENWELFMKQHIALQVKLYIEKLLFQKARNKLEKVTEWLQNHIYNRFITFFEQDKDGVPRQWIDSNSEKIKEIYLDARNEALIVCKVFESAAKEDAESRYTNLLEVLALDKETPLITPEKMKQVLGRANRQMQQKCQEAQLLLLTNGRGMNVPWWLWVILFALGYNELVMILFSPFSLIAVLITIIIGAICYFTNNISLPLQLSRHAVAMTASCLIPILSSVQQPVATKNVPLKVETTKREVEEQ